MPSPGTEGVTSASAPQNWMPWRARRTGVGQGWTVLDGPAIWGLYGVYMGFPKNGGSPTMVGLYSGNPIQMDDLEVPPFQEPPILSKEKHVLEMTDPGHVPIFLLM